MLMIFQLMPANNVARHSNVESTRGNSPLEWQATWRSHFLQPDKSDAVQNIYQAANRDRIIEIGEAFHDPVFHDPVSTLC
ncbi:MAG: hypothetical protein ACI8T1_002323 [Verrucomicrobiales bacterium]|jgi:hypothetical protein